MGEVYRATDTNLKRQVAIKVLPASVAGDTDRLARFQREAEVLAALNYPHIAARQPDAALALLRFLASPDVAPTLLKAGLTPPAGRELLQRRTSLRG